jgi:hypothetical protein
MFLTTLLMNFLSLQISSRSRQILLLYIAAIIMMFKKLRSFHKRNQGKEKIFCLPHWARSRHPQDSRLLDIEFLRSNLFFFFFTTISLLPPVLLHKTVGTWNLEWGSVLQQNVTSRTDGREDIVNLYIRL